MVSIFIETLEIQALINAESHYHLLRSLLT